MPKTVICSVDSPSHADAIAARLENAGVPKAHISVLMHERVATREFASASSHAPESVTVGDAGSVADGVSDLLARMGALSMPGTGPFIAVGPIMAGLAGAAAGATLGSITGALTGFGMAEAAAKALETRIHAGHILISVHTHDHDEAQRIQEILMHADARHISINGENDLHTFDPVM